MDDNEQLGEEKLKADCLAIKDWLSQTAKNYENSVLTHGQRGGVIGALDKNLGSSVMRRIFLSWAFSPDPLEMEMSSKSLTNGQWYALWSWVDFFEEDGIWHKSAKFIVECAKIRRFLSTWMPLTNN